MTHNVTGLVNTVRDYYPLTYCMYTKGGATSSHPSESLDGFHHRENGASHAAVETIVSEVVHMDSVRPKHRSLDIPEALVPPERDGLWPATSRI